MRIPFATQAYQSQSLPVSAQRCVNLYAEKAPRGRTNVALFGTPGLVRWATVGEGPIRGIHEMVGLLYVVSGTEVYKLDRSKAATRLGTVHGCDSVIMQDNGFQILLLVGQGAGDAYVVTSTDVNRITDPDFPGAGSATFLDQYLIISEPDSARFHISALLDVTSWDALDFATAEANTDKLLRVFADHRELWLLGEESAEIWTNTGISPFPLERQSGTFVERGIAAPDSAVKLDNTVYWIGDDSIVYRSEGYIPTGVSQHGIEGVLQRSDLSDVHAFTHTLDGHPFYVIRKPNAFTYAYDVRTKLWHERQTYGRDDWRVTGHARAFGKDFVIDEAAIYELDPDVYTDDGGTIQRIAASPQLWADAQRAHMKNLVVDMEAGVGLTTGQGSDPQAMLRISDDGGRSWSNERWAGIGKIGENEQQARWNRLGQFRQRVLELTISDPVKTVILGAYSDTQGARL